MAWNGSSPAPAPTLADSSTIRTPQQPFIAWHVHTGECTIHSFIHSCGPCRWQWPACGEALRHACILVCVWCLCVCLNQSRCFLECVCVCLPVPGLVVQFVPSCLHASSEAAPVESVKLPPHTPTAKWCRMCPAAVRCCFLLHPDYRSPRSPTGSGKQLLQRPFSPSVYIICRFKI